ncbi:MAG: hypothetical protein ABSF13_05620 [Smithella sp.]|jgi:hypothetical protein
MPINQNCLFQLQQIGLPMIVEVKKSKAQPIITEAKIHIDGTITDLKTGKKYPQPSALRQELVAKNTATYRHLFFNGRSLSELGVRP